MMVGGICLTDREDYISFLRFGAMCSIVLCHLLQFYGNALAWWFNVGVQIFLIISGFLYGRKEEIKAVSFIAKEFKKILLNYYVYLIVSLPFYVLVFHNPFSIKAFLKLLLGVGDVPGLGHLWFVSTILFCYLITPALSKISGGGVREFACILVLFEVVLRYIPYFTGAWVNCYIIGFCLGKRKISKESVDKKAVVIVLIMAAIINGGRCLKDSILLNNYGHVLLALSIFLIAMLCFPLQLNNKVFKTLLKLSDKYSYDVYLTHHIYILGAHSMLKVMSPQIGIPAVSILTIASAFCLERICGFIKRKEANV